MVESLATIMADFPGEANRSRCLAHIVNLVVKIILRQFDVSRKKKKNKDIPFDTTGNGDDEDREMIAEVEDEVEKMERILDKEEKEMDDGDEDDDEDKTTLVRDIETMESAMEEEIEEVSKLAKPVCQVLYKVSPIFFSVFLFLRSDCHLYPPIFTLFKFPAAFFFF